MGKSFKRKKNIQNNLKSHVSDAMLASTATSCKCNQLYTTLRAIWNSYLALNLLGAEHFTCSI